MKTDVRYTFGTGEIAADRLQEISEFFNPLSTEFIRTHVGDQVGYVLDLGCGPGFTTAMLSGALQCERAFGLDTSRPFLEKAKRRFPHITFIAHDVTKTPFPIRADVIYSRFLLSHLKEVVNLVNRWLSELHDGGTLIAEELEGIDTALPVFQRYLTLNTGLVESQGAELYVGGRLAEGRYEARVVENEVMSAPVENYRAATWFYPNTVSIWEQEEYILEYQQKHRQGLQHSPNLQRQQQHHGQYLE